MPDQFTQEKDNIIYLLRESYRIMRLTYVSPAGSEFTEMARMKVKEIMDQIEKEFKKINETIK